MKKNLLSIIILALLVVNIAMTGFMLLSVMTTNSQTAKLISDIAAALELEANGGESGGFTGSAGGGVANIATYGFTGDDQLTINLKPGADGKSHYMLVEVVFTMNTASGDYATLGTEESLANMRSLIKGKITNVLSSYTLEELQADDAPAKDKILDEVQELFNSNFIYEVTFSSVLYQ
ncbi:MAG: flagellar basal body-associated FliL family protein [Butyrivibrio sp.]|nr:flagellar basal body-associated FliL family protein [Butyrivibrio sp.]